MNGDDFLAGSMTSREVFGNESPPADTQKLLQEELEHINSIVPTADRQIAELNQEIAAANKLTDFIGALGVLPSEVSEDSLRAKLEARYGYINYLITRKNKIIDGLRSIEQEANDTPVDTPIPSHQIVIPRPAGIAQKIAAMWRRWRM